MGILFGVAVGLFFAAGASGSPPQSAKSGDPPAASGERAKAPNPVKQNSDHSTEKSSSDDAETETQAQVAEDEPNQVAIHDPSSSQYDADCLACHEDVLTTPSADPRILSHHQAMTPFTPGYNPAHGPSNEVCVQCHRSVEIRMDSAGALRKQVNPELCALCHGPAGPGQVYYAQ